MGVEVASRVTEWNQAKRALGSAGWAHGGYVEGVVGKCPA